MVHYTPKQRLIIRRHFKTVFKRLITGKFRPRPGSKKYRLFTKIGRFTTPQSGLLGRFGGG